MYQRIYQARLGILIWFKSILVIDYATPKVIVSIIGKNNIILPHLPRQK